MPEQRQIPAMFQPLQLPPDEHLLPEARRQWLTAQDEQYTAHFNRAREKLTRLLNTLSGEDPAAIYEQLQHICSAAVLMRDSYKITMQAAAALQQLERSHA